MKDYTQLIGSFEAQDHCGSTYCLLIRASACQFTPSADQNDGLRLRLRPSFQPDEDLSPRQSPLLLSAATSAFPCSVCFPESVPGFLCLRPHGSGSLSQLFCFCFQWVLYRYLCHRHRGGSVRDPAISFSSHGSSSLEGHTASEAQFPP